MFAMRRWFLATALAATLLASWVEWPTSEIVQPVSARAKEPQTAATLPPRPSAGAVPSPAAAAPKDSARLVARARAEPTKVDLFAPRQWQPPPKEPAPVVQRAAEVVKAPPLPFQYLGMVMDGPDIQVFVSRGALTHLLRKGDVQADYKVEKITPSEMMLVYLPLNEKQRLQFGSAN